MNDDDLPPAVDDHGRTPGGNGQRPRLHVGRTATRRRCTSRATSNVRPGAPPALRRRHGATDEHAAVPAAVPGTAHDRASITEPRPPLWERAAHGMQQALSEDNRNKEISAPPAAQPRIANEIYLIRHGETQGYSTESGLTPLGSWQAHTYGHTLAKRIKPASGRAGLRGDQPGPADRRADPPRARRRPRDVREGRRGRRPHRRGGVPQLRGRHPRRAEGRHRRVPAVLRQLEEFERTALGDRPCGWSRSTGSGAPSRAAATRSSTG
jgi:hypothetical protein